ncbi:MAG: FecR family protein [Lentisphaerales bacterium]|nr:FecR family protein [Lentisphaerales bacterium]
MKDDLKLFIEIWLSEEEHTEMDRLVERLQNDDEFRSAFTDEVIMMGKIKAVTAGEPRFAMLEEILNSRTENAINFDEGIFNSLEKEEKQKKIIQFAAMIAAMLIVAFIIFRPETKSTSDRPIVFAPKNPIKDKVVQQNLNPEEQQNSSDVMAIISATSNAVWSNDKFNYMDTVKKEEVELIEGSARLDFLTGVSMLITPGTKLKITGSKEIFLSKGIISCLVNEFGKGFTAKTDDAVVVDIGTSFQVEKSPKKTMVHVLDGEVKVRPINSKTFTHLSEKHSVKVLNGKVTKAQKEKPLTSTIQDFEIKIEKTRLQRYQSWREQNIKLKNDPSTLFHLIKSQKPIRLINQDLHNKNQRQVHPVGVTNTIGRWPQNNGALQFSDFEDRVMARIPYKGHNFTLISWINLDRFSQNEHAIMTFELIDRWTQNTPGANLRQSAPDYKENDFHALRWTINKRGEISLNAFYWGKSKVPGTLKVHTFKTKPAVISPKDFGKWLCLGVTYDYNKKEVIHYLNGQPKNKIPIDNTHPVDMNFMEIGNLTHPDNDRVKRQPFQFKGKMDEILIADRPYSEEEMKQYFENSRAK